MPDNDTSQDRRDDNDTKSLTTNTLTTNTLTTGDDTETSANRDSPQQGQRDIGGYVPTK